MTASDHQEHGFAPGSIYDLPSVEIQVLIDRICTEFESLWHIDQRPSIEHMIAANPLIHPAWLLRELIPIELELRLRIGERGTAAEYLQRFSNHPLMIEELVAEFFADTPDQFEVSSGSQRYVRLAELDRGGMGIVYEGWDQVLRREVAIKVIDRQLADDWEARVRFQREPRICGSLQHPNIIPIYDVGITEDGSPFFVMKRIHGQTLDRWLLDQGELKSMEQRIEVFLAIARAVASAHRKKILHRDIKPSNIMIADFGEVYVMDWGLARQENFDTENTIPTGDSPPPSSDGPLTDCGTVFGTPDYMAPEQRMHVEQHMHADRQLHAGPRSRPQVDVYSLGALLCWMLTQKLPRQLFSQATGNADSPNDMINALKLLDIDSFLARVVAKSVAPCPDERYATASELVEEVEAYQSWMAESARDSQRRADAMVHQAKLSRHRWQTLGVACLSLTLIAAGLLWIQQRTENARQKRVAEATRLLSRVEEVYSAAVMTDDFHSPLWQQAVELHKSIQGLIKDLNEPQTASANSELEQRLALMSSLRSVPEYVYDGAIREFTTAQYRNAGLEAMRAFGVEPKTMTVEEASQRLGTLSSGARRMIAGFLVDCCVVAALKKESFAENPWWAKLAALEEQQVLGTSLLDSLIQYDRKVLIEIVETKSYRELSAELLASLATVLSEITESERAEEVFRFAVAQYPNSYSLNNDFCQFLLHQKPIRSVEALEFCSAAWTLQKHEASMLNLSWCLIKCGMYERAVELIESNEKKYLEKVESLKFFFRELIGRRRIDHAKRLVQIMEVRKCDPVFLHVSKGELAAAQYRFATAGREYALAQSLCATNASQFAEIAYLEGCIGCLDNVCKKLEEFHRADPNNYEVLFNLAQLRQRQERYEVAESLYRKCIEMHPEYGEAICNLAYCVNRLNRRKEAMELYKRGHEVGLRSQNWVYDSASWIRSIEEEIAIAADIDSFVNKQLIERKPTEFYWLITEHLRPTKRFDVAYQLCKAIPDNLSDPKLWLTAASVAADHFRCEVNRSQDSTEQHPKEAVDDMLNWMETAVSILESLRLEGNNAGQQGEYFVLAMREAMQTETYRALRGTAIRDSMSCESQEKLDSLWIRLIKRLESMVEELG